MAVPPQAFSSYLFTMARLRVGTCSWKYPSWAGLVYSRPDGIDFLAEYARKYSTVEVDQWFWTLTPSPADVERYRAAVPGEFRFTVKAPNALTLVHAPGKKGAERQIAQNPASGRAARAGLIKASAAAACSAKSPVMWAALKGNIRGPVFLI